MKTRYPNLAKLELVADALGALREQLVFVGGCAVDLLLTDPAAASTRITFDVDLVARVEARLINNPEEGRGWEVIAPIKDIPYPVVL